MLLVSAVNIRGKNNSREPITNVEAYLVPQIRREPHLELLYADPRHIELLDTKQHFIEPGAEFQLSYRIPPYDRSKTRQGVPVELFLSTYGGLTFVFSAAGDKHFSREFRYVDVEAALLKRQQEYDASTKPPPGIKPIPN
jgi:hypothetical protein